MGIGEDKTPRVYKDVPFNLVIQLAQAYEARDRWLEGSAGYEQYSVKIEKLRAVLEYIATGGIN